MPRKPPPTNAITVFGSLQSIPVSAESAAVASAPSNVMSACGSLITRPTRPTSSGSTALGLVGLRSVAIDCMPSGVSWSGKPAIAWSVQVFDAGSYEETKFHSSSS